MTLIQRKRPSIHLSAICHPNPCESVLTHFSMEHETGHLISNLQSEYLIGLHFHFIFIEIISFFIENLTLTPTTPQPRSTPLNLLILFMTHDSPIPNPSRSLPRNSSTEGAGANLLYSAPGFEGMRGYSLAHEIGFHQPPQLESHSII
jgi:hypothetical protein